MTKFIADPTLAVTMGAASRRIAENRYDVRKVNTLLLEAMELNGGSAAPIIVSPNRGRGQRMVDILVASMAAVAAAPLMLLAAAAIAVGLGRPVLFTRSEEHTSELQS